MKPENAKPLIGRTVPYVPSRGPSGIILITKVCPDGDLIGTFEAGQSNSGQCVRCTIDDLIAF